MKSTKWLLILLGLSLLAGVSGAQAPIWESEGNTGEPLFYIDVARFASEDSNLVHLEVYYQVFNTGLEFVSQNDLWTAHYEFGINISDDDAVAATFSKDGQIRVADSVKTASRYDYRSSQASFDLKPGKYEVVCKLSDIRSRKSSSRRLDVELKLSDSRIPAMSDVEFVQSVERLENENSIFAKGNTLIIPSVSRTYGGDDSRLLYYMEIYPGADTGGAIIVETRMRHNTKGMIYRDTLHTELTEPRIRQLRQISIEEFPAGHYEMEVYLRGRRDKKLDEQHFEFDIIQTQVGLIKHDWENVVRQLAYIAEPGEVDYLKKMVALDSRKTAYAEFWIKRDPTVGTAENEAKTEFHRRIRVANQRFGDSRRDGWMSDRGRIFIIHGEPDQIDDYPYSANTVPYQIWHYYTKGRYRRFTFVDDNEDGEFRLQFPYDGLNQRPDF